MLGENLIDLLVRHSGFGVEAEVNFRNPDSSSFGQVADCLRKPGHHCTVPGCWRSQQTLRKYFVRIEACQKTNVILLRKHPGDQSINDAVKDEVIRRGHGREQRCMSEEHVVKFVHNQHEKLLGRIGMGGNELGIYQQARLNAAFNRRGCNFIALNDIHQTQQS